MNEENIVKIENILFDLHLGIKEAAKIRFLNNEHLRRYMKILEKNDCINETNQKSIYFKNSNRLVIFGKNYKIGRSKLTFIASSIEGCDDYIQVGQNEFIKN